MQTSALQAKVQMLIRRPVAEVFNAFIDPAVTTQFWFTKSSGRLEPGTQVQWDWEMYGASAHVEVKAIEPNQRILIAWDAGDTVEWRFEPRGDDQTFVTITNTGFTGTDEEIMAAALDSTGGFTFLIAGLKAFLEHGIRLNLIADHVPDAHVAGWDNPR